MLHWLGYKVEIQKFKPLVFFKKENRKKYGKTFRQAGFSANLESVSGNNITCLFFFFLAPFLPPSIFFLRLLHPKQNKKNKKTKNKKTKNKKQKTRNKN